MPEKPVLTPAQIVRELTQHATHLDRFVKAVDANFTTPGDAKVFPTPVALESMKAIVELLS